MSDIVTSRVFQDGEKGITAQKLNDITASSVIQPTFYTGKPVGSTADPADVMLILKAGAYTQVPVSTLANSLSNAAIWSVRLRSFNSVGNCTFECDQRNVGNAITANGYIQDRWQLFRTGTSAVSCNRVTLGGSPPVIFVPGTSFAITGNVLRVTLTTAQASLGATDQIAIFQNIEGIQLRELIGDVHSVSILARSSVANLSFGLSIRDTNVTHSLVNLCTLGAANAWTLIQLPNIPVFVSGGSWGLGPGVAGYIMLVSLASGATITAPANGTWQNGNFTGAVGQSNFAASPVGSTIDFAFMQHEPGPLCTTLMDKPFTQNYDECLRYFTKSYDYSVLAGATGVNGFKSFIAPTTAAGSGTLVFPKPMAKTPTIVLYNHSTGAVNSVQDGGGVNHTGAVGAYPNTMGFGAITFTTATTGIMPVYAQYTADTGW